MLVYALLLILRQHNADTPLLLVLDNARYQTTQEVQDLAVRLFGHHVVLFATVLAQLELDRAVLAYSQEAGGAKQVLRHVC